MTTLSVRVSSASGCVCGAGYYSRVVSLSSLPPASGGVVVVDEEVLRDNATGLALCEVCAVGSYCPGAGGSG
eukprot:568739-Rhodomonas_salina.1